MVKKPHYVWMVNTVKLTFIYIYVFHLFNTPDKRRVNGKQNDKNHGLKSQFFGACVFKASRLKLQISYVIYIFDDCTL